MPSLNQAKLFKQLDNARTQGRGGLGSIVVFASGNFNQLFSGVTFPANVAGVITVGAVDRNGNIHNYSSRGSEMDLVAPSGLTGGNGDVNTTDRMGVLGYDNGNYTNTFGGTSAACPQVSGVAALILSVNPNLTETQVRAILQNTATDMGSSGFDNTFGFGRVNAFAAVQMAQLLDDVDQVCFDINTTINLDNSQNNPVTWQVSYNVNKISSNNTSITIRSKYANSTSTGWVKATLNGNEFTETFGVNGSENEIPMNVTVNLVNNYLTITIHDGSGQTPYYLYLNNAYMLSTNSRTITFPYYHNSGRIEIRNQNSCETGWNYAFYTGYFGGSYYSNYNVFPNPASETLTLQRKELTSNEIANSNFDANQSNEKSEFELYDFNQNLISKGQINNLTNINVSNFKKGRYILLIITNGNYESHQIIIN